MVENPAFWAFISYNHSDERWAAWLHRAIEQYKIPSRLVGRDTPTGPAPDRLRPLFRDRDDLSAASDLGEHLRHNLAASRYLIVICSPECAKSQWTNEEIRYFKQVHPTGRVLAAIVDGTPMATANGGRSELECFPPALRFHVADDGTITDQPAEPLAADLRKEGDGRRRGLLKLIAGMLGVGLDELVQRDHQRRNRRLMALAASLLVGMAGTSTLAIYALNQRDAAEYQREQADGLIEFMLTDLRKKLEPVGRLDVLDDVGKRAVTYYDGQNVRSLGSDALGRQARGRLLVGEVANLRGDLKEAEAAYRSAALTTAEQLRRSPSDPERMYDHAQSEFWVGYLGYQQGKLESALAHFENYRRLAEAMLTAAPGDRKYLGELSYARGNLGTVQLELGRTRSACDSFYAQRRMTDRLLTEAPDLHQARLDAAQARAWIGTCEYRRARQGKLAVLARRNWRSTASCWPRIPTMPAPSGRRRSPLQT